MSERVTLYCALTCVLPQHNATPHAFRNIQKRYTHRPVQHFPWKEFHLKMTTDGYVSGSDWAMTTFDTRTDDQFFDEKQLQTIHENIEVRYFLPYHPLDFSNELADYDVLDEFRQLEQQKRESYTNRLYIGTMSTLAQAELKIRKFYCRLTGYAHAK